MIVLLAINLKLKRTILVEVLPLEQLHAGATPAISTIP